jgi:iron complex outermembrane recepter protein
MICVSTKWIPHSYSSIRRLDLPTVPKLVNAFTCLWQGDPKNPIETTLLMQQIRRKCSQKWRASANVYYMDYKNQLVLTGALNDVGAPLRVNARDSYRTGIELEAGADFLEDFSFYANLTLNRNKIQTFDEILYDYTNGFDALSIRHENTDISFSPSIISAGRLSYNIYLLSSEYYQGKTNFKTSITWQSKYVGKQYLDNTQSEKRIIEAYTVSDIILFHERKFTKWQFNVQLTINNIFNSMYSSNGYTYGYVYETRISERFYYPQAGRNFMVSVGVKV